MRVRCDRGVVLVLGCLTLLLCVSCATTGGINRTQPSPAQGGTGYLAGDSDRYILDLVRGGQTFQATGSKGKPIQLAAGAYAIDRCIFERNDSNGVTWQVTGMPRGAASVMVSANATTQLAVGPPLKLALSATKSGDTVTFGFSIKGKAGEFYAPAILRGNQALPPPGVEIRDAAGKIIARGQFKYG
jgi:hypothetical protein